MRTRLPLAPALAAVLAAHGLPMTPAAHAGWPNDPRINVRLSTNNNPRYNAALDTDQQGGAFVAWHDQRDIGTTGYDIYVQRVTDRGTIASGWSATGLALCTAAGDQTNVVVVSDDAGGAFVGWLDLRSGNSDIYATRVTGGGAIAPGWPANGLAISTATGDQVGLTAARDGYGGVYFVWQDARNGNNDVFAQRITASGSVATNWTATGVAMCTDAAEQTNPVCVADGVGGVLAAWEDQRNGNKDIFVHHLHSAGSVPPGWTGNGIALCTATGPQTTPVIVADGAGGAVVAWTDSRGVDDDIYAQRVGSLGAIPAGWTANGVALSTATGLQYAPAAAPDGTGGAIVAWTDTRSDPNGDVYARRINGSGAPQWSANGEAVCTAAFNQGGIGILSDGAGGAFIAWGDSRGGAYADLLGVRLTAAGALASGWTANGSPISTAEGSQALPRMTPDGRGGVIVAFLDGRGSLDLYVQGVDGLGNLGAQPTIVSVRDVPNDQGGAVRVAWTASPLDAYPDYTIDSYRVLRSVPAAAAAGARGGPASESRIVSIFDHGTRFFWELVGTVPALQTGAYGFVASTTGDSVGGSNPRTAFMVQARNADGSMSWSSDPDSGYSVDNLAPTVPAPFTGQFSAGTTHLHWGKNPEPDLALYRLHRGGSADFVPSPGNLIAEQPDTGYVDVAGSASYYKLAAVDVHGNQSGHALLTPAQTAGTPEAAGSAGLWLAPPTPNPVTDGALIAFSQPRAGDVVLAVHDAAGRRVRELLAGLLPAGEHRVRWDGRDERRHAVPSGRYFVRLEAGGRSLVRAVAVTR